MFKLQIQNTFIINYNTNQISQRRKEKQKKISIQNFFQFQNVEILNQQVLEKQNQFWINKALHIHNFIWPNFSEFSIIIFHKNMGSACYTSKCKVQQQKQERFDEEITDVPEECGVQKIMKFKIENTIRRKYIRFSVYDTHNQEILDSLSSQTYSENGKQLKTTYTSHSFLKNRQQSTLIPQTLDNESCNLSMRDSGRSVRSQKGILKYKQDSLKALTPGRKVRFSGDIVEKSNTFKYFYDL
ncbi:hypothetical protein pb186bvf_010097 [Paramecium bursaria]